MPPRLWLIRGATMCEQIHFNTPLGFVSLVGVDTSQSKSGAIERHTLTTKPIVGWIVPAPYRFGSLIRLPNCHPARFIQLVSKLAPAHEWIDRTVTIILHNAKSSEE